MPQPNRMAYSRIDFFLKGRPYPKSLSCNVNYAN
jgi:hypothetical protein